jgi:hypothetical protein
MKVRKREGKKFHRKERRYQKKDGKADRNKLKKLIK